MNEGSTVSFFKDTVDPSFMLILVSKGKEDYTNQIILFSFKTHKKGTIHLSHSMTTHHAVLLEKPPYGST